MERVQKIVSKLNAPRVVCQHLFGKDHTAAHRMIVGAVVMIAGVGIAKLGGHSEAHILAYLSDVIGYAIHGIGLTPFLEALIAEVIDIA